MVAEPTIAISPGEVFSDEIGQFWAPAKIELSWPPFPGLQPPSITVNVVALANPDMTAEQLQRAQISAAHDVISSALLFLERTEHPSPSFWNREVQPGSPGAA